MVVSEGQGASQIEGILCCGVRLYPLLHGLWSDFSRSYGIVFVSNQNYAPHTKAHQRFRAKAPLIAASVSGHITPQQLH